MAAQTVDQILDALNDYSDWEETGSVSRANSYITAARRFLALPSSQSFQSSSMGMSPQFVSQQMDAARAFIQTADTNNAANTRIRFLSASEGFRR